MTKVLFTALVCLFFIPCYSQYAFNLKIKTSTINGAKIQLYLLDNKKMLALGKDSAVFKDNQLQLRGKVKQESNYASFSVTYKGQKSSVLFVIDSGENIIDLDLVKGNLNKPVISNSNTKSNLIEAQVLDVALKKYDDYYLSSGKKPPATLPVDIYNQMLIAQNKVLESYPDEYFSVLALSYLSYFDNGAEYAKVILATLATFSDRLRNSALGKQIYDRKSKLISGINAAKVGNKVMDFSVKDINGKLFNSRSLRGKNYIIAFSATWCMPCQEHLPVLKRLYENYKSKGLEVVYFNLDDNIVKWKNNVAKNKTDWINVSERLSMSKSKIQRSFGVYAIPTCLIIDKTGQIVYNSDQNDNDMNKLEAGIGQLFN